MYPLKTGIMKISCISLKTFAAILAVSIFLSASVFAVHSAIVTADRNFVGGGISQTYNFTIINNGYSNIIAINIRLPQGFVFENSVSCPANWASIYMESEKTLKCSMSFPEMRKILPGGRDFVSLQARSNSASEDETKFWEVTTYDDAGSSTKNNVEIMVDVTGPYISNIKAYPGHNGYIKSSFNISAVVTDPNGSGIGSCEYTIGGTNYSPAAYNSTTNICIKEGLNLPDGEIANINFMAADNAGNKGSGSAVAMVSDTTAPSSSLSIGKPKYEKDAIYVTSDTEFMLESSDTGSGLANNSPEYKIDNGLWRQYSSPFGIGGSGKHAIYYRSSDSLNNTVDQKSIAVIADNEAPSIGSISVTPFFASNANLFVSGISKISAPVVDAISGIASCAIGLEGKWTEASYLDGACMISSINTSSATRINIKVADNLGNEKISPSLQILPDIYPPETTDNATGEKWNKNPVEVLLKGNDNEGGSGTNKTYYCVDQTNACTPNMAGNVVSVNTNGINFIRFMSADNIGNREKIKSTETRIDNNAPETSYAVDATEKGEFILSLNAKDIESGISATFYTTDGTDPTESSAKYESNAITLKNVSLIKYFSADNVGNAETVKTIYAEQIIKGKGAPTGLFLGISGSALALTIIFAGIVFLLFYRFKKRGKKEHTHQKSCSSA